MKTYFKACSCKAPLFEGSKDRPGALTVPAIEAYTFGQSLMGKTEIPHVATSHMICFGI